MIKRIISNPILTLFIGIAIPILIYYLQISEKEPVYSIISNDLIAKSNVNDRLKILWDTAVIEDVHLAKVAIWNEGKKYIDKSDISINNPIRISPSQSCFILDVKAIKKSRDNLNFNSTITNHKLSADSMGIKIEIKGDDGLEQFDGAIFQILFSSKKNITWKVDGRIKECSSGFKNHELDEGSIKDIKNSRSNLILDLVLMAFLSFGVYLSVVSTQNDMKKAVTKKSKVESWLILILFLSIFGGFIIHLGFDLCNVIKHWDSLLWLFS